MLVELGLAACLVVRVIDGDSLSVRCDPGAQLVQVRIAAIDAPELNQPAGQDAKRVLMKLTHGRTVQLDCLKRDRYRRALCALSTQAQGDIGLAMVRKGMAWCFSRYLHEQPAGWRQRCERAQQLAQQAAHGLWRDPQAHAPWSWRR